MQRAMGMSRWVGEPQGKTYCISSQKKHTAQAARAKLYTERTTQRVDLILPKETQFSNFPTGNMDQADRIQ